MSRFKVTASDSSGTYDLPPAGNHPANLVGLIDLGSHLEEYQGDRYTARKVLFAWELSAEMKPDGSPYVVLQDYTMLEKMTAKSKLRQMLQAWRGKALADNEDLDLGALLGKQCMVNLGHKKSAKGNDYYTILGISQVPRGMTVPKPHALLTSWHFEDGLDALDLPHWLPFLYGRPVGDHIKEANEAKTGAASNSALVGAAAGSAGEDFIPF